MKNWKQIAPLNVNDIILVDFPKDQYYEAQYLKTQQVWHHTVSDPDYSWGDINYWRKTQEAIATSLIVQGDGQVYQCFNTSYLGAHIGVSGRWDMEQHSIGVELDNWGGLTYDPHRGFINAYDQVVDVDENNIIIFEDGFRGYNYFEAYTEIQIDRAYQIADYLCEKYEIPRGYNADMWDVSDKAISGVPGIWTHTAFRSDKSDCFPQETFIQMLKALK